jgi:hypothetical protein
MTDIKQLLDDIKQLLEKASPRPWPPINEHDSPDDELAVRAVNEYEALLEAERVLRLIDGSLPHVGGGDSVHLALAALDEARKYNGEE